MKKTHTRGFITWQEAVENSFNLGILLGCSLGELPNRVASQIAFSKSEQKIEEILREEINSVFRPFEDWLKRGGRDEAKR